MLFDTIPRLAATLVITCLFLGLTGTVGLDAREHPDAQSAKLDRAGAEAYMAGNPQVFLLDVRSVEEFGQKHVPGAVNIPVGELKDRLDELPENRPILIYCGSGKRSLQAYKLLREEKARNGSPVGQPGIFYATEGLAK